METLNKILLWILSKTSNIEKAVEKVESKETKKDPNEDIEFSWGFKKSNG